MQVHLQTLSYNTALKSIKNIGPIYHFSILAYDSERETQRDMAAILKSEITSIENVLLKINDKKLG